MNKIHDQIREIYTSPAVAAFILRETNVSIDNPLYVIWLAMTTAQSRPAMLLRVT